MNSQPIGFMDSGVGGLTVVKSAIVQLPNEDIVYFGDEARLPYGEKSPAQIKQYASEIARFLYHQQIKVLAVACNTATSLALPVLQKLLPIPVIGVIQPGSQLALSTTHNNQVGVIATNATINSDAYEHTLKKLNSQVKVHSLGCPDFVSLVENGQYHSDQVQGQVDQELAHLKNSGIDTLIMGCTHYPLMRKLIQKAVGTKINLIDPAVGVANQLKQILQDQQLENVPHQPLKYRFYTTGNRDSFTEIAEDWLNLKVNVEQVSLEELKKYAH